MATTTQTQNPSEDVGRSVPRPPAGGGRSVESVRAELDEARRQHAALRKACDDYWLKRDRMIERRHKAELIWKSNPVNVDVPFDSDLYPGGLAVPPEETEDTIRFHKVHERIAKLEAELVVARRALVDA